MDDIDAHLQHAWDDACLEGTQAQAAVLVDLLHADADYAPSTARRIGRIVSGLAARQATLGHDSLDRLDPASAHGFVAARTRRGQLPSLATMHLRRTAIRAAVGLMAELGTDVPDPTVGLRLPPKGRTDHRPLDPAELTLLRLAAASRPRRRSAAMTTVAATEAGATTGEVARLRWVDVDVDSATLDLPGAGPTIARIVELTSWGARVLRRHEHATRPDPDDLVVYRGGADPESDTAQAAVTSRLRRLLDAAGLRDGDLRPGSVRLCLPAARLAEDGRVGDAARRLGLTSLDVTAEVCGWDWQG